MPDPADLQDAHEDSARADEASRMILSATEIVVVPLRDEMRVIPLVFFVIPDSVSQDMEKE